MDTSKVAPPAVDSGSEPSCRPAPPLLVSVDLVPEAQRATLARCATEARCRIFEAVGSDRGAFVVGGQPDDLARLGALLQPVRALDFVREAIETRLDGVVAPGSGSVPRLRESLYKQTEVAEDVPVAPGTTLLVSRDFSFDAAHNLPRYHGKCERLHGHTFRVRVTVRAPLDTWSGMAFDFHDLKKAVEGRVVKVLDHSYINETVPNPSAEYLAIWIWERLSDLPLHEVKVWETPTCFVTYGGPPREPSSR